MKKKVLNNDSDQQKYHSLQEQQKKEWEELCLRCGACCGIFDDDPCQHLKKVKEGQFVCQIYDNRLGIQKTGRHKN